mmetsp:Transcript_42929/g.64959  ORF Transcript_42929/g.64959 Transcript_42929/m.64959 type:complete len:99 (-) Transcript_42929:278-574(-)
MCMDYTGPSLDKQNNKNKKVTVLHIMCACLTQKLDRKNSRGDISGKKRSSTQSRAGMFSTFRIACLMAKSAMISSLPPRMAWNLKLFWNFSTTYPMPL